MPQSLVYQNENVAKYRFSHQPCDTYWKKMKQFLDHKTFLDPIQKYNKVLLHLSHKNAMNKHCGPNNFGHFLSIYYKFVIKQHGDAGQIIAQIITVDFLRIHFF